MKRALNGFRSIKVELVGDTVRSIKKNQSTKNDQVQKQATEVRCIESAVSLMTNIVETACERELDLDLMRLINFMDLYRVYLQLAGDPESDLHAYITSISGPSEAVLTQKLGETELVSFERFVRDSRLLNMAATAASRETGEKVAPPPPLTVSAND